jgi:hypothetical protein
MLYSSSGYKTDALQNTDIHQQNYSVATQKITADYWILFEALSNTKNCTNELDVALKLGQESNKNPFGSPICPTWLH